MLFPLCPLCAASNTGVGATQTTTEWLGQSFPSAGHDELSGFHFFRFFFFFFSTAIIGMTS